MSVTHAHHGEGRGKGRLQKIHAASIFPEFSPLQIGKLNHLAVLRPLYIHVFPRCLSKGEGYYVKVTLRQFALAFCRPTPQYSTCMHGCMHCGFH